MDIRVLRYFVSVAEEGSFSKASLRLRVAQPALSQHIRRLEEELGCELLHRTARGISLTDSGTQLLGDAKDILSRIDAVQENIRSFAAIPVGTVSLAMSQSVAGVLAVPLFRAMRTLLPGVALRLKDSNTGYIPEMLRRRELDLGVVFKDPQDAAISHSIMLLEDLHLVSPAGPPPVDITFAEAAALPLFLPGRPHSVRNLIDDYARRCGVTLNVIGEVDGIPQLRDFAAAGLGHTMLSPASIRDDVAAARVSIRKIVEPAICRPVVICHASNLALSRAAAAVKTLTIKVAQQLVSEGHWLGTLPRPIGP
jgi:LysR family nitrogen assimilation transcriptional regulator